MASCVFQINSMMMEWKYLAGTFTWDIYYEHSENWDIPGHFVSEEGGEGQKILKNQNVRGHLL